MENLNFITGAFENGVLNYLDEEIKINELAWNASPANEGVFLKHIITGAMTNNSFSAHLVKVEEGCRIALHTHPGKTELHEVAGGEGTGFIKEKAIKYKPGVVTIIPADVEHEVAAGKGGVYIFAKFFPALI